RRAAARLLCRLTSAHIRNLEVGKGSFLMAVDGCRSAARDLGVELVAAGVVDEIDDVFYFTVPELVEGPGAGAREVVAFRKARREEYRKLDLPVTFTGMPEPVAAAADTGGDDDVVTGAPGSAGVVEGRARVVLEAGEATLLEPGEVLVCRFTDPSWSPLMVLADALVIDIGGPASHGAIVARELGIPCVIGTGNGTTRLHTGDQLRVDGAAGVVEVLARMESS
ncbi:MAG: PEP-utilizing enzyme, partial [Acidimicrobiia bacterium]